MLSVIDDAVVAEPLAQEQPVAIAGDCEAIRVGSRAG